MARESSPTPLAAGPSGPSTPGSDRPSLNESLDELARLSDDLIDQMTADPLPAVVAAAPREVVVPPARPGALADMARGKAEPDLDAIFDHLHIQTSTTAAAPPTGRIAARSVEPPAAVPTQREHTPTPPNIREVLKHLETMPHADSKAPWESIEPSVAPEAHSAPGPRAVPSLVIPPLDTPARRGHGRSWLIAGGLAIAAGLGAALLLQTPKTDERTVPESAAHTAPAPAPARVPAPRPEPPSRTAAPPVVQDAQPLTIPGTPPHIDSPVAQQTSPAPVPAKAKAAPAEVRPAAKPSTTSPARAAIAAPAPRPPTSSLPAADAKTARVEPTTPAKAPDAAAVAAAAPVPVPVPGSGSVETPPIDTAAPADPAPTDPPVAMPQPAPAIEKGNVESPQIENQLEDAGRGETALPVTPAPAPSAPALPIYAPPRLIARTEPEYPAEARARGESGTIVLRLLINESGIVERGVVEAGISGSKLEAAAVSAAMKWTYEPARQSGRPVRAWITERIVFTP